jgi:cytochrome c5
LLATALTASLLVIVVALYAWQRFGGDAPVAYDKIEEHFKYGSTGGEHESGFPYWIFQAMPRICGQHLPGKGYASLGMVFEPGHDLPVGMSKRRYQGIDRTFLNCAVCHASTVRSAPGDKPEVVLAMPAQTFDLMGFQKFIFACGKDPKFSKEFLIPEIAAMMQEQGQKLDLLDRKVVYPLAVWIMRERLITLGGRFQWTESQQPWGPGRVDTFNAAKVLFNFPVHQLPANELNASSDFPSIWNQQPREGMQLHWDGNNTDVTERNKSAAFGTGTTPPTLDTKAIKRLEDWLLKLDAPKYRWAIDTTKAERGKKIYGEYCAACHGATSRDFAGEYVGKVTPWEKVRTDKHRLDSYSYDLAVNQSTLYAGYPWRFTHFRKTFGYANMPLDGLWLRAPYLHNGSVPNLRSLLDPASARPTKFYRGDDVYDQERVGFRSTESGNDNRRYFLFDTTIVGNSNAGHEGASYGTELAAADKDALVEYLKTF